eukprot:12937604-Prorocentrum_lima.AAC.1
MKMLRRMSDGLNKRPEEVTMQVEVLMAERGPVGELMGNVAGVKRDLHHLQQDFTMMKDTMTSELA